MAYVCVCFRYLALGLIAISTSYLSFTICVAKHYTSLTLALPSPYKWHTHTLLVSIKCQMSCLYVALWTILIYALKFNCGLDHLPASKSDVCFVHFDTFASTFHFLRVINLLLHGIHTILRHGMHHITFKHFMGTNKYNVYNIICQNQMRICSVRAYTVQISKLNSV